MNKIVCLLIGAALTALYYKQKEQEHRMDEFNTAIAAFKTAVNTRLDSEKAEVVKAIQDLKDQIGTGDGLPKAAVLAALTELSASVETGIGNIFEPTTPPVG